MVCAEPSVTERFGLELMSFLESWQGRDGLAWTMGFEGSFIAMPPSVDEHGNRWRQSRRGPQIKLHLVITDTTRVDELPLAWYLDGSETVRASNPLRPPPAEKG